MPVCDRLSHKTAVLAYLTLSAGLAPAQSYEIGHTSIAYVDSERGNRQVPAEIYYPAGDKGDDVPVVDPEGEGFPVIAFGHGYLMPWNAYSNVWNALVPEGYIVALARTASELLPDHLDFGLDLTLLIREIQRDGTDPSSLFCRKVATTSCVMGHSMGGGASFLAARANPEITAIDVRSGMEDK